MLQPGFNGINHKIGPGIGKEVFVSLVLGIHMFLESVGDEGSGFLGIHTSQLLLYILCIKSHQFPFLKFRMNFNRITAYFTIFNIGLPGDGWVQDHGNLFPAVRALEKMFVHEINFQTLLQIYEIRQTSQVLKTWEVFTPQL